MPYHRPKDVAAQFGISSATLRNWSDWFAPVLSPAAQKAMTETGTPAQRRYADQDLAVFKRIKELRAQGLDNDAILTALQADPTPEPITEPEETDQESEPITETALSPNLDEHPVFVAFREALAAKDQTIQAKDQTIAALEANLNDLRRDHEALLARVETSPPPVSVPWWKRLFSGS